MCNRNLFALAFGLLLTAGVSRGTGAADKQGSQQKAAPERAFTKLAGAKPVVTPSQMARALFLPAKKEDWKPGIQKSRGPALPLYPRVAPATVVVRTPGGHGAGIVVDPSGWILTNQHCVAMAGTDVATGAQVVLVHIGRIQDGVMQLAGDGIPGIVHKVNEEKDLALVKLSRLPEGMQALPALSLTTQPPVPGTECVAIGHPAAGMLWTVRSCEVTNVGQWPEQQIDFIITRLQASTAEDQDRLRALASQMPKIKIVLSSCGLNPGDSGGPLVNTQGELIGITFAIPASEPGSTVSLDKFAYHIHAEEMAAFLADRPAEPLLHVPDPWPPAVVSAILDLDKDEKPETLAFGMGPNGPFTGLLADLDENNLPQFSPEEASAAGEFHWDFEFAWQPYPEPRAFYDTNDDGEFDLILVDPNGDGKADVDLELAGGSWSRKDAAGRKMQDAALVPEPTRGRFAAILAEMPQGR